MKTADHPYAALQIVKLSTTAKEHILAAKKEKNELGTYVH